MPRLLGTTTYEISVKWDGSNWTDETARVRDFRIRRGRDDNLTAVNAGELYLTLNDPERFNPANTGSAIYPYIARPLREVRVRAVQGVTTYPLFHGWTRTHEADPTPGVTTAWVEANDSFILLDEVYPVIASGTTTTGGAIAAILDEAAFPGSEVLDNGDDITFEATGEVSALQLIADLLTTERGLFFFATDGTATYLDRHAQNRAPYTSAQSTISDTMRALASAVDRDQVWNRATVARTGGTAQTYHDATGALGARIRDYRPIESGYLANDAQALALATYLVAQRKDGVSPIRYLDINNGQATPFAALLAREIGDRVAVVDSIGGTTGDYHIQGIDHEVDWSAQIHRGTWRLLKRDATQPLMWDVSIWDDPIDVWTY